jgi:acyl-coenzyme A thioesterase 13
MEDNKIVAILKSTIGKEFRENPSKYGAWLGGKLIEVEEGKLTAEYTVRKEMSNGIGTLHGGVIAGILDDLMGTTVVSLGSKNCYTTVNLNIDYFYPAKEGDVITAKAFMVKKGNIIHHVQAELWNLSTGKLLAKGSSNLLKIDVEVKYPVK